MSQSQSPAPDLAAIGVELGRIVDRTVQAAEQERLSPEAAEAVARATQAYAAALVDVQATTAPRLAELASTPSSPTFARGSREYYEVLSADYLRQVAAGEIR